MDEVWKAINERDEIVRKELGEAIIDLIQEPRFSSMVYDDLAIILQAILDSFGIDENRTMLRIPKILEEGKKE